MVRCNDFGRRIIPGFLIVVVDVVVVAAAASALGSRLPVLRVCVGEQHLGCFHPAPVAGLHTWLVHGLFDRHLGSWDAFTHSDNACISLFGLEVFQTQISNARPLHPHADLRKYSLRWIFIGMDIHGDGYFFHFPSQLFVQIKMIWQRSDILHFTMMIILFDFSVQKSIHQNFTTSALRISSVT